MYNKRMETIKIFNKLQENEIEKSILNNEILVKFCNYENYKNNNNKKNKIIKYTTTSSFFSYDGLILLRNDKLYTLSNKIK